jgi:hypothetical protein
MRRVNIIMPITADHLIPRGQLRKQYSIEQSRQEFGNFPRDGWIDVIGKVRRCDADRSIGTF